MKAARRHIARYTKNFVELPAYRCRGMPSENGTMAPMHSASAVPSHSVLCFQLRRRRSISASRSPSCFASSAAAALARAFSSFRLTHTLQFQTRTGQWRPFVGNQLRLIASLRCIACLTGRKGTRCSIDYGRRDVAVTLVKLANNQGTRCSIDYGRRGRWWGCREREPVEYIPEIVRKTRHTMRRRRTCGDSESILYTKGTIPCRHLLCILCARSSSDVAISRATKRWLFGNVYDFSRNMPCATADKTCDDICSDIVAREYLAGTIAFCSSCHQATHRVRKRPCSYIAGKGIRKERSAPRGDSEPARNRAAYKTRLTLPQSVPLKL